MKLDWKITPVSLAITVTIFVLPYMLALAVVNVTALAFVSSRLPRIVGDADTGLYFQNAMPAHGGDTDDFYVSSEDDFNKLVDLGKAELFLPAVVKGSIEFGFPFSFFVSAPYSMQVNFAKGPVRVNGMLVLHDWHWVFLNMRMQPQGSAAALLASLPSCQCGSPRLETVEHARRYQAMLQGKNSLLPEPAASTDGSTAVEDLGMQADQLLITGQYAALDQLYTDIMTHDKRLQDGSSQLVALDKGLNSMLFSGSFTHAYAMISAWRQASPQSPAAAIVEADYWTAFAWYARSSAAAALVSPERMDVFQQRLRRAQQAFLACRDYADSSPLWYIRYGEVAAGLQDEALIQQLFTEGSQRFPYFEAIYAQQVWAMQPRWYGDFDIEDRLIRQAVERTREREGTSFYARLYVAMDSEQDSGFNIFRDSKAQWPLMKQGFDDWMQRYPGSQRLLNTYASYACEAGDRAAFQALASRIGEVPLNRDAWRGQASYDDCVSRLGRGG